MKTSVIEVHDMLSVLSVDEIEKRIGKVPGVESVTVNHAAANATVRYDETRIEVGDIKSAVRQLGYEPETPDTGAGKDHENHKAPGAPPSTPPAAPKPSPGAPAASPPPSVPPAPPKNATSTPPPSPMPMGDQPKSPAKG